MDREEDEKADSQAPVLTDAMTTQSVIGSIF